MCYSKDEFLNVLAMKRKTRANVHVIAWNWWPLWWIEQ